MADLIIETSEGIRLRSEIASAGSRSAAGLIDLAIFWFAYLLLAFFAVMVASFDPTGVSGFFLGLVIGGFALFLVAYNALFGIFGGGRTIGKMLLGIRVVDLQGFPATWMQHVLRSLFWPLEVALCVPLPLGMILIAVTDRRQRLGDLVAGTIVLRRIDTRMSVDPYRRDTWSKLTKRRLPLVPALAERFDGEDLAFLRNLLGRRRVDPGAREKLLIRAARHYGNQLDLTLEDELTKKEAEGMLRELYLFLRETRGAYSSSE